MHRKLPVHNLQYVICRVPLKALPCSDEKTECLLCYHSNQQVSGYLQCSFLSQTSTVHATNCLPHHLYAFDTILFICRIRYGVHLRLMLSQDAPATLALSWSNEGQIEQLLCLQQLLGLQYGTVTGEHAQ